MTQPPFEQAGSLRVGVVEFVSLDEIKVALDIDAPESIALNAGDPRPFPRVNTYLLVSVDDNFLVGQVGWITTERAPFVKRHGMRDGGLVDLPYPLRRLSLNPLGTLRTLRSEKSSGSGEKYAFQRGTEAMPPVGAAVVLPTETQLHSIVESGEYRRVNIGTSPLAGDAEVSISPDRLFGRHLAVLGNTGSGKSCSVAGLIRWSLETTLTEKKQQPNARFIVLDPNGEYSRAFGNDNTIKARIFKVNPDSTKANEKALKVPFWFWNSAEWCSFTQASARTQRPALIEAIRQVKDGDAEPKPDPSHDTRRFLRIVLTTIEQEKNDGNPWSRYPKTKGFYDKLENWKKGLEFDLGKFTCAKNERLEALVDMMEKLCAPHRVEYPNYNFERGEVEELLEATRQAHFAFGGTDADYLPGDVDVPRPFTGESLLRSIEAAGEKLNVSQHIETLLIRVRSLLADNRMKPIIEDEGTILEEWLKNHLGNGNSKDGCISIIDLSLVPTEVVHIVTAVIARIIFEALQRYMQLNKVSLPTVLVMDEAHTFIKRYKEDIENQDAASVCCQVFERIAREGRKFGLGLVLSSQRPSELSSTVLSQCNTFLLHRISNDRDQDLVQRFVPDNLRGLLRELPSLPSQNAILLGWASEIPMLVKIKDLPRSQQPRSDDPEFWGVWIGKDDKGKSISREVNWGEITNKWQSNPTAQDKNDEEQNS